MRLIADESLNYKLVMAIRNLGFQIMSVSEDFPSLKDIEIVSFSLQPPSVIITEDKDFGELVYRDKIPVVGIILLRYEPFQYTDMEKKIASFLLNYFEEMNKSFTVITVNKTRIRPLQ